LRPTPAAELVTAPAPSSFELEPLFLGLGAAAAILYVRSTRRERPSRKQALLFTAGLLLVVGSLDSPLETIARHYLLLFHLLQNALVADWAPPLLILGLTTAGRAGLARTGGRPWEFLTRPAVALPLWLGAWYGVHLPAFYDVALRHPVLLNVEHLILLTAGAIFWWPVFEPEPRRLSTPTTLVYLVAAFFLSAFLSLIFIFDARPLYDFYAHAPRLWGFSAARDQNLGGVLMQSEQTLVFFAAIAWFFVRLFDEEDEAQRARERPEPLPLAVDGHGGATEG
jgi:cytochrome c oxidase assembly factor CtaG